jgi:hypothetical protein
MGLIALAEKNTLSSSDVGLLFLPSNSLKPPDTLFPRVTDDGHFGHNRQNCHGHLCRVNLF